LKVPDARAESDPVLAPFGNDRLRAPSEDVCVLVVEDDDRLRKLLGRFFERAGYRVCVVPDAGAAHRILAVLRFDLLVLDVMMPDESGLELATALRRGGLETPILFLSALSAPEDRVAGLAIGAEDYLGKPFDSRELLIRARVLVSRERAPRRQTVRCARLCFGGTVYDVERGEFRLGDGTVNALTNTECDLMRIFAMHPKETMTREAIIAALPLDARPSTDRVIDVRVSRIRRKLEPDVEAPRYLRTVRGAGYMLMPDEIIVGEAR